MANKILVEICLFFVLLILVTVQVVVYWFCTRAASNADSKLGMDQAQLDFYYRYHPSDLEVINFTMTFSQRSHNCYKCEFTFITTLMHGQNFSYFVDTTFPVTILVTCNQSGTNLFNFTRHFQEFSRYCYNIMYNESASSNPYGNLVHEESGSNAFLPILYAAVVIVAISLAWVIMSFVARYRKEKGYCKFFHLNVLDRLMHQDLGPPISSRSGSILRYGTVTGNGERNPLLDSNYSSNVLLGQDAVVRTTTDPTPQMQSKRLISLDAFRGMSLVIMIFVNYGGGGYWFFNHSKWNGLTVADLVFPWFVWIMGVSLVFSFRGRKKEPLLYQLYQIFRRTIILFAVGIFLTTSEDTPLTNLRIPGVLQRLAATYFVVALTEALTSPLYNTKKDSSRICSCVFSKVESTRIQENQLHRMCICSCGSLKDLTHNWVQWLVVLLLEMVWLLITFLLHQRGCPSGYLGPGGTLSNMTNPNCTGGAAGLIDRWLLGNGHLFNNSTPKELYHLEVNYDPEGVLGTLNSIVLCYLGVQAGKIFLYFRGRHAAIILRLIVWGVSLSIIGSVLCLGQRNEGWIPINKNLWSLSFILVMGGTGYLVLVFFYFTIDVTHWWNGSPFRYPGMNSIIVYVGHELLGSYFPFAVYNQENRHLTYLTANLVAVSLWMLIAFYWYSVGFFVKV